MSKLKTIWDEIVETITSVEFSPINDIVDILLVTAIIYLAFKFLRDRRAGKLVVGVILFFILLLIIFSKLFSNAIFLISSLVYPPRGIIMSLSWSCLKRYKKYDWSFFSAIPFFR